MKIMVDTSTSTIREKDFIVCVGGGRWGAKAATLARKFEARAIVIDFNQNCLASKVVDTILTDKDASWTQFKGISLVVGNIEDILVDILRYESPQWIIPAVPGGIGGKLLEKWLTAREIKITKSGKLLRAILAGLPQKLLLSADEGSGTIISSYMPKGMWCKIPCSQPEICPVAGYKKIAPMYDLLEFSLAEIVDYYKIFVNHDLGGVGAIPGAEVKEWQEQIEKIKSPCSVAVGTSCKCHAIVNLFEVGKD
jgi:hypothetical protein